MNKTKGGEDRDRERESGEKEALWIRLQIGQETPTNNHAEWVDRERERERVGNDVSIIMVM